MYQILGRDTNFPIGRFMRALRVLLSISQYRVIAQSALRSTLEGCSLKLAYDILILPPERPNLSRDKWITFHPSIP